MTAKELAIELNGRDTGEEMEWGEVQDAKAAGLVVVYGYSDDNVELFGAINDEVGAYEGTTVYLTPAGVLQEPDCDLDDCPCFAKERERAKTIKAVWHDEGGPCWTFETDIPHETFTIMEDGEPWCIGIVFSVEELRCLPAIYDPPNAPLTLEQLREMDGEPVWVQHLKKPELSAWALYYYDPRRQAGAVYSMKFEAVDRDYDDTSCEKVWLAYRRRPEEFRHG